MKTVQNTMRKSYRIGLVYIGSKEPFQYVDVVETNTTSALNRATNYLSPNHMQTLTVMSEKPYKKVY